MNERFSVDFASDRTVHAWSPDWEVVRYDRAGKWYLEPREGTPGLRRRQITVKRAVEAAMKCWLQDGTVNFGRPGGSRFDYLVRKAVQERRSLEDQQSAADVAFVNHEGEDDRRRDGAS